MEISKINEFSLHASLVVASSAIVIATDIYYFILIKYTGVYFSCNSSLLKFYPGKNAVGIYFVEYLLSHQRVLCVFCFTNYQQS